MSITTLASKVLHGGSVTRHWFWGVGLLVLLHFLIALFLFVVLRSQSGPVVLGYNVFLGIDLIGSWWQALLLPVLSLAFTLSNLFLAHRFARLGQRLWATLLLLGSGLVVFALFIAALALTLINN